MKIKEFQKQLKKQKIDVALFFDMEEKITSNAFYFVQQVFSGCLVIQQNKKPFIVTADMEAEKAKKTGLPVLTYEQSMLEKVFKKVGKVKTVGLDYHGMTHGFFDMAKNRMKKILGKAPKVKDIGGICRKLRILKTKEEGKLLKKACAISDQVLKTTFKNWKKFKTEKDVEDFLITETRKTHCGLSFRPIVASGKGAAQPHYIPQATKLKKGFCVIDFGVKYKGYCSDTTRTIYLGSPSQKEKEIYNLLLKAQQTSVKKARVGITKTFGDLHKNCAEDLGEYKDKFIHSLGHGVGIDVHEAPGVGPRSTTKLQNGICFTIEPGIYVEGKFGMRIEDTLLIENRKAVVLTKISKKLVVIK